MKDVRPMAEERARQKAREARGKPAERPPGTGFMTERARAKEALRAEVSTYTGEGIHKIPTAAQAAQEDRILRVAAYCRVSTEDVDQLWSIELQKRNSKPIPNGATPAPTWTTDSPERTLITGRPSNS